MKKFSKIILLVIITLVFTTNGEKIGGYRRLAESRVIFSGTYFLKLFSHNKIIFPTKDS